MNKTVIGTVAYAALLLIYQYSACLKAETEPVQLNTLEVTSSPFKSHSQLELTQPADVMSGDQLMLRTQSTLGETLEQQLGATASDFNPIGASRPVIRGLGGSRVMILENGASAMDVSDISADHAVSIEPVLARQIEILKGPSTLLYGSGAIGGVVNVVNDRIPSSLPEKIEGVFEGRFNSSTKERTGAFRVDGSAGNFALHGDGMYLRTDNYEAATGTVENSDVRIGQWSTGGSYIGESGWLGAGVSQLYDKYAIPVAEGEEAPFIDLKQTRVNLQSRLDDPFAGFSGFNFDFAWGDYEHTEFENPEEAGTQFENKEYYLALQLEHNPWAQWLGAFGLQGGTRDLKATGEEAFVPPTKSWQIAGYLLEERSFGAWHLELGARVEHKSYQPEQQRPDRSFTPYSLSTGTRWDFHDDYDFRINLARAQRAPNVQETYALGPHVATQTFEIGNPNLSVETSNNIDVSLNKSDGRWTWTLNGFYNYFQDYIFLRETDSNGDGMPDYVDEEGELDPDGPFLRVVNAQKNANFYGIEGATSYRLLEGEYGNLDTRLWGDWVRGIFTDGSNIPRMPPWRVGGNLQYGYAKWLASIDIWRVGEQDNTADLETKTPGYTMLNLNLVYKIPTKPVDFSIYLRGTNLLNEDARRSTSFLKDVAPLPGRAATIGLRGDF